ncbi:hypothetical protein BDP55DRAFT_720302 [Colletotrichum godetiae]|uniref:Uncharacterized protein n=1 Tax=Colletotrichum godetiae TaxID=1209918 RepID=A0AAJ0A9C9_9PEZI|nr:uncharacterized protein BDP55DRAFT_720302 [Colletotrichum godetiae]KAK1658933.1 hypothetical protein BDP55DRAFT_720302 [Colletotrichum godetiae]
MKAGVQGATFAQTGLALFSASLVFFLIFFRTSSRSYALAIREIQSSLLASRFCTGHRAALRRDDGRKRDTLIAAKKKRAGKEGRLHLANTVHNCCRDKEHPHPVVQRGASTAQGTFEAMILQCLPDFHLRSTYVLRRATLLRRHAAKATTDTHKDWALSSRPIVTSKQTSFAAHIIAVFCGVSSRPSHVRLDRHCRQVVYASPIYLKFSYDDMPLSPKSRAAGRKLTGRGMLTSSAQLGRAMSSKRIRKIPYNSRLQSVMDTVLQFEALFLAKKRQLAHLKSENRLCAVLAKPGEAASYGAWGKAAKGLSCLAGERRGPRQMDGQGWPMFGPCCGYEFKIRKKSARQNLERQAAELGLAA